KGGGVDGKEGGWRWNAGKKGRKGGEDRRRGEKKKGEKSIIVKQFHRVRPLWDQKAHNLQMI
ncbi:hypothetical protein ACI1VM_23540, partial [Escherichia coli]